MRVFFWAKWWILIGLTALAVAGCRQGGFEAPKSCWSDYDCASAGGVCHPAADSDGACGPACAVDEDASCAGVADGTVCFLDGRCAPESLSCGADFECGRDGARCLTDADIDGVCASLSQ
jgi:hypothetical protein